MNTTESTRPMKLTTCERRALHFCQKLNHYNGGTIQIEWKRSRMWGYNPVISSYEGKCCNVSGCGYDKKSAALAEVLKFLFPIGSDGFDAIAPLGGCGESTVKEALAKHGWNLRGVAHGSTYDAYELTRKEGE